jgi:hypothetical protein
MFGNVPLGPSIEEKLIAGVREQSGPPSNALAWAIKAFDQNGFQTKALTLKR